MPIIQSYEIHRGRQSEMDRTGTGTATIVMADTNGSLDPAVGTNYDPMTPVAIALTNPVTGVSSPIFTGHVARWGYDHYPNEKYATATLECVDAMDVFANAEMTPGTYGDPAPLSSLGSVYFDVDDQVKNRIDMILDDLGWPAGNREIFTGNIRLQKTTYANRQPALNAISDAADAEFPGVANFYMQKNGFATFHGRLARFNPTDPQYGITTWKAGDLAAFNVDSGTAVITDLEYDRDKDRIINSAIATPENIHPNDVEAQRVENAASIAQHGHRSWSAEDLIILSSWLTGKTAVAECKDVFATYYVTNYNQPQTRVSRIQFKTVAPGVGYAGPTWALMTGVDISDRIQLTADNFSAAMYYVEGLHYMVEPLNASYLNVTLDLDLSPAAYWNTLPS